MNTTSNFAPIDVDATVADLVVRYPATASVLQRHKIDFCCKGNIPLQDALEGRDEAAEVILAELQLVLEAAGVARESEQLGSIPIRELLGLIVDRHHTYLRRTLPFLVGLSAKVAAVHGPREPMLEQLETLVRELSDTLQPHLAYEETTLFPMLLESASDPGSVKTELARMLEEHLAVGRMLSRLREVTSDYSTPDWGCISYRTLMAELEDLESDTLRHVHTENHVLMPHFVSPSETGLPGRTHDHPCC